jgi:hypothetical protein
VFTEHFLFWSEVRPQIHTQQSSGRRFGTVCGAEWAHSLNAYYFDGLVENRSIHISAAPTATTVWHLKSWTRIILSSLKVDLSGPK